VTRRRRDPGSTTANIIAAILITVAVVLASLALADLYARSTA
jgi:hypothetical protein